jgi:hypothetical protein
VYANTVPLPQETLEAYKDVVYMGVLEIRLFEITQPGCRVGKDTFRTLLGENVI